MSSEAPLFGREFLLARLRSSLSAHASTDPSVVRLTGEAGYGKTAILDALVGETERIANGVVFRVTCDSDSETYALAGLLGSQAVALPLRFPRHVSGLEMLFDNDLSRIPRERIEIGFSRLIVALATDCRVTIAIDDAQWLDEDSAGALRRALAAAARGNVRLVLASRPATAREDWSPLEVVDLSVGTLGTDATTTLVRTIYPGAPQALATAIVQASGGVPLTATVLARQAEAAGAFAPDDLQATLSASIEQDIRAMPASTRALLHVCSILREPIRYTLLRTLWDDGELLDALARVAERYLVQRTDGFGFIHLSVRTAVAQTAKVVAPLQRRALEALATLEHPSLSELRDIVDLSAAIGDRAQEYRAAIGLAERATEHHHWSLAAEAYARAIAADDTDHDFAVVLHDRYADVLRLLERDDEVVVMLEPFVGRLAASPPRGFGRLVGTLASSLWSVSRTDDAVAVCKRYLRLLPDGDERAELESRSVAFEAYRSPRLSPERVDRLAALRNSVLPSVARRAIATQLYCSIFKGDTSTARRELATLHAAEDYGSIVAPRYGPILDLFADFHEFGATRTRSIALEGYLRSADSIGSYLAIVTQAEFAMGLWRLALDRIAETDLSRLSETMRAACLIPCAAMLTLGKIDHPVRALVETHAEAALRSPHPGNAIELVLWRSLESAAAPPADRLISIERWLAEPTPADWSFHIPLGEALFAERFGSDTAHRIALRRSPEATSRWNSANEDLRIGMLSGEHSLLARGRHTLRDLGAFALAAIGAERAGLADERERELLRETGIAGATAETAPSPRKATLLTLREREVCDLVIEGQSNRDIARALFVSERTVETHVSNALSKTGTRSRTELARVLSSREREA